MLTTRIPKWRKTGDLFRRASPVPGIVLSIAIVFLVFHLTASRRQRFGRKVYGYVISTRADRFLSTSSVLKKCDISARLLSPIPPDSDLVINTGNFKGEGKSMLKFAKTLSNKLTHIRALEMISEDTHLEDDSWGFVFEDDITFNHGIDETNCAHIISRAMEISVGTGYMQLGSCNPGGHFCGPLVDTIEGVEIRHCCGTCAHAYGATKLTAARIYSLMYQRSPLKNVSDRLFYYFDQQMMLGCRNSPVIDQPLLIGCNIFTPGSVLGHLGIFIQDRKKFPSEILD